MRDLSYVTLQMIDLDSMTFQIRDTIGIYNFETEDGTIMLFDGRVEHRVLRQKHTGVRVNITFRKHF